jgi:hypothetical protein
MKKIIPLIIVILVGFKSFGQTYYPLLKKDNTWNVLYESDINLKGAIAKDSLARLKCFYDYSAFYRQTEVFKLSSDTSVNGTKYIKLISSFDSLSTDWKIKAFLREDTIKEIVYYNSGNGTEHILYAFKVKVKDTIGINTVNFIDTIIINNIPHKRIKLSYGRTWIEGIGGLQGLLTSSFPMPMCGPNILLLCFYNNEPLVYKPQSENYKKCFYWTNVNDGIASKLDNTGYKLFPVPTSNYLYITSESEGLLRVEVVNLEGIVLLKLDNIVKNCQLDLRGCNKGMYLVRISDKYNVVIYKIVKE